MSGNMPTISTGQPATLRTYRQIAEALSMAWGIGIEDSPVLRFIDAKAAEAPKGLDEIVIAAESQVLMLFVGMLEKELIQRSGEDETDEN